jgi:hypothetical protein
MPFLQPRAKEGINAYKGTEMIETLHGHLNLPLKNWLLGEEGFWKMFGLVVTRKNL